jgi:GDP-D-mannose dehydratase
VSSIAKSFKLSKEIQISNYLGAKKFLEVIYKHKFNIKFFKANSGYIFQNNNNKINLNSKLTKPFNPYIFAQIKAYKLIKHHRKLGMNCYSIIFFNIESLLKPKEFFIKKICNAVKQE